MTVALLPAAPLITDSATTFPGIANTFFAALGTMVSEVNTDVASYATSPLTVLPALPGSTSFVTGADAFVASLQGLVDDVNVIIADLVLPVADVTDLPATPSRTADPGNFTTEGPAFLVALDTLEAELNAFIAALNAYDPFAIPPDVLRTVLGNAEYTAPSTGSSALARLVKITTPSGFSSTLPSVWVAVQTISGSVGMKALLVADNAGAPSSTVIAIGNAVTPSAISAVDTEVELPFASDQTLSPATDYWIGYVPSGSMTIMTADTSLGTVGYQVSSNYAAPTWDSSTDVTSDRHAIWAIVDQPTTITGLHHQGFSPSLYASAGAFRMKIPPHAIGDKIVLHTGQNFGTAPTISGYSAFATNGYSGGTHILLEHVIDGTESGSIAVPAPSTNLRTAAVIVFRGGGTREGTQVSSSSGTSPTSPAVTVTAAGRVYNFLLSGEGGSGASNAGSADTWTDLYAYGTTAGNDFTMSCSYKDVASGSSGTETRTISNGFFQWTCFSVKDV